MTTHELKIWPEFFASLEAGEMNFNIRKNDRDYRIGDVCVFKEWDPHSKSFTGHKATRVISYIAHGTGTGGIEPYKGLSQGWCVIALKLPATTGF